MTATRENSASRLPRGRRALFTGIYLAILAAFLLAGIELICRLRFDDGQVGMHGSTGGDLTYDAVAGWRGTRNLSAAVTHAMYPVPVQVDINADGFRDESWDAKLERARLSGAAKILIVGDSVLYGFANPVDGRLSEQLRTLYRLAGRNVEVFNAGIPAYGPHNQLRILPELLARIRPRDVVLLFCINDYGDAALPYASYNAFRVYQPFYDSTARLLFNDPVPRRPSLVMRDTALGRLRLWYAVDQLRYAIEDRRYARYGIPNARTAPLPFEGHLGDRALLARFPYLETTVFADYARMAELSRKAGARFTILSSIRNVPPNWEPVEELLGPKLSARGIRLLVPPANSHLYGRWYPALHNGHPNFIWAWILANGLYSDLEGQPYRLDFAELPQLPEVPAALDLANTAASVRFLGLNWQASQSRGRTLGGEASFFLRNEWPGPSQLEVEGSAARPTRLVARTVGEREICRFTLATASTQSCAIDTAGAGPILFVDLRPEGALDGAALPVVQSLRLRPNPLPDEAFRVQWVASRVPEVMTPGSNGTVTVTIRNKSRLTWPDPASSGHEPPPVGAVRLGYRWLPAISPTASAWAPARADLARPLKPAETARLRLTVTAPPVAGDYLLQVDLVQEAVTWFEAKGAPRLMVGVRVRGQGPALTNEGS